MNSLHFKELAVEFPGNEIPKQLKLLCDFQDESQFCHYSGDFIIDSHAGQSLSRPPALPRRSSFAGFGNDDTGGVFAFWSGDEHELEVKNMESSPIVYIDSEAVYSSVISCSFLNFVSLLLIGVNNLGRIAAREEEICRTIKNGENHKFCEWARLVFGVDIPVVPLETVRTAKRRKRPENC